MVALSALLLAGTSRWRFPAPRRHTRADVPANVFYWLWVSLSIVVAGVAWRVLWHAVPLPFSLAIGPVDLSDLGRTQWAAILLPALPAAAASLMLVLARWLVSTLASRVPSRRRWQGALDSALARNLLLASAWVVIAALWVCGQTVAATGPVGIASAIATSAASGGAFTWARRLLGAEPHKPSSGKTSRLAGPFALKALAILALGAATVSTSSLLAMTHAKSGSTGLLYLALAASAISVLALLFFDPAEVGLHSFYRSRLTRDYLAPPTNPSSARHG